MRFIKLLLFLFSIFYFNPTFATKWYVDEASNVGDVFTSLSIAGNDANSGSALAPFQTMTFAIATASAFDTIYVDSGIYNQRFTVTKSLYIFGAGTSNTIFDGALKTAAGGTCMNLTANIKLHIKNVTATHYNQGLFMNVFGTLATDNISFRADTVNFSDNFTNGMYFNADCKIRKLEVYGSTFNTNDGSAIARGLLALGQNKDTVIIKNSQFLNNKFVGFDLNSPLASGSNIYALLKNNTVTNCLQPGISLHGFLSALIDSNTVTNAGHCAIELKTCKGNGLQSGPGSFVVRRNIISRNTPSIDRRDICGIGVINRDQNIAGLAGTIQSSGIALIENEISGYALLNVPVTAPTYLASDVALWAAAPFNGGIPNTFFDAIGIVVEGQNHLLLRNKITNCEVGMLVQERPITTANTTPPISDYFDANRSYTISTAGTILDKNGFYTCPINIRGIGLTSILNASNSFLDQITDVGAKSTIQNLASSIPLAFPAITPPLVVIPSGIPTGLIDYTPWIRFNTDALAIGYQPNLSYLIVDDDSPQSIAAGRVQEGHDTVQGAFPLIVEICSGLYPERNEVNKTVRYNGLLMPVIDKVKMNGLADTLTIIGSFYIKDSLICNDGLINTKTPTTITLKDIAKADLGTSTSYVNGPLKAEFQTVSAVNFNLPVGKETTGNRFMNFKFNQTAASMVTYVAEYFATGAPSLIKNPPIISTWVENSYWNLSDGNINAFNSPTLTLNYGVNDYPIATQHSVVKNDNFGTPAWAALSEITPIWTATSGTVATSPLQNIKFTTLGEFAIAPIAVCPTVSFTTNSPVCFGDTIRFTNLSNIGTGQTISNYTWNFGDGTANLIQTGPFSNPFPAGNPSNPLHLYTSANTFTVKLISTAGSGCKDSLSIAVVVNALPTLTISSTASVSICAGNSIVLTPTTSATTFSWSNSIITQTNTVSSAGIYSLTVTDINSCQATATVNVKVNALPTLTVSPTNSISICAGNSTILTATSSATTYSWSNGIITPTNSVSSAGVYTITVTDINLCQATNTIDVIVNALPTLTINPITSATICAGSNTTFTATSSATSFSWSSGAITPSVTLNTAGIYSLTVTDANLCQTTATVNLVVNALPTVTIIPTGTLNICSGDNAILIASTSVGTYSWSNGAITQTISVSTAGVYTVVVTDGNLCSSLPSSVAISTTTCFAQIALAKSNDAPVFQADNAYLVTYHITVANLGNDVLQNIQVIENLDAAFPLPATYSLVSVSQPSGILSLNPFFNGNTDVNLIGLPTNSLAPNQSTVIDLVISFIPNTLTSFSNQVSGTGTGYNGPTSDNSTSGSNPDPNGNGNPNDAGESESTVFTISGELFIPTGFSPDGDGVNDNFQITAIERYPNNKVTIFNRWGNIVYQKDAYTNTEAWDATNQGKGINVGTGKVQGGTYFYSIVLDVNDNTLKPSTGYITIKY